MPLRGRAQTAQGEAIRIAGKIDDEIKRNGGANWDGDYRKMLRIFPEYLRIGKILPEKDLLKVKHITQILRDGRDSGNNSERLCSYAVSWVLKDPQIITPLNAYYMR